MHIYFPILYALLTSGIELSRKKKEKGTLEKGELETHIVFIITSLVFTLLLSQIKKDEKDLEYIITAIFIFTVLIFEFNIFSNNEEVKRPVYTQEINVWVLCVLYIGYYRKKNLFNFLLLLKF